MKFAHMADCHIGCWRDPKLSEASTQAFTKAMNICHDKGVDFILISGDLFNTAHPPIDTLKAVVTKLKQLKDQGINIYIIPGSHDFTSSGKTIIDVLDKAGLLINVSKGQAKDNKLFLRFFQDKSGAKITGMLGKKNALEKSYYDTLDRDSLEKEPGFKIFMFHSALTELKPKGLENMDSSPLSVLPKNFNYYAGGHVHSVVEHSLDPGIIVIPGPLFPTNFLELEELSSGGFYIYNNGKLEFQRIQLFNTERIIIQCDHITPQQVQQQIMDQIKNREFINTIVLVRLFGDLESGRMSDINFKEIKSAIYDKGAYYVSINKNKLQTTDLKEIKINTGSIEEIESSLIQEHIGKIKIDSVNINQEKELIEKLLAALNTEKLEGEKKADFESRIKLEAKNILNLD